MRTVHVNFYEDGYVRDWSVDPLENDIVVDVEDWDDFDVNSRSYKRVGDGVVKDEEKLKSIQLEKEIEMIRLTREEECFPVINRGGIWYDTLTEQEKSDLMDWYQAWLNATDTLVIPEKPSWLK